MKTDNIDRAIKISQQIRIELMKNGLESIEELAHTMEILMCKTHDQLALDGDLVGVRLSLPSNDKIDDILDDACLYATEEYLEDEASRIGAKLVIKKIRGNEA